MVQWIGSQNIAPQAPINKAVQTPGDKLGDGVKGTQGAQTVIEVSKVAVQQAMAKQTQTGLSVDVEA